MRFFLPLRRLHGDLRLFFFVGDGVAGTASGVSRHTATLPLSPSLPSPPVLPLPPGVVGAASGVSGIATSSSSPLLLPPSFASTTATPGR